MFHEWHSAPFHIPSCRIITREGNFIFEYFDDIFSEKLLRQHRTEKSKLPLEFSKLFSPNDQIIRYRND